MHACQIRLWLIWSWCYTFPPDTLGLNTPETSVQPLRREGTSREQCLSVWQAETEWMHLCVCVCTAHSPGFRHCIASGYFPGCLQSAAEVSELRKEVVWGRSLHTFHSLFSLSVSFELGVWQLNSSIEGWAEFRGSERMCNYKRVMWRWWQWWWWNPSD